ncbi:MAG: hypothetical protein HC828_12455, partial [Blastochloris sp.]|nr:hypothetical protein [Blastochloris sp.]
MGLDVIDGGGGDDVLVGGNDTDSLTGGTGADSFRFDTTFESRASGAQTPDAILDF